MDQLKLKAFIFDLCSRGKQKAEDPKRIFRTVRTHPLCRDDIKIVCRMETQKLRRKEIKGNKRIS